MPQPHPTASIHRNAVEREPLGNRYGRDCGNLTSLSCLRQGPGEPLSCHPLCFVGIFPLNDLTQRNELKKLYANALPSPPYRNQVLKQTKMAAVSTVYSLRTFVDFNTNCWPDGLLWVGECLPGESSARGCRGVGKSVG